MSKQVVTGPGFYKQRDGGKAEVVAIDACGNGVGLDSFRNAAVWFPSGTDFDCAATSLIAPWEDPPQTVTKQAWYVEKDGEGRLASVAPVSPAFWDVVVGPVDVTFTLPPKKEPRVVEGWVNVYEDCTGGTVHESPDEARRNAGRDSIGIFKVRFVEGEGDES